MTGSGPPNPRSVEGQPNSERAPLRGRTTYRSGLALFDPLVLRSVRLVNRIAYPAAGFQNLAGDQQLVQLGMRAWGGAGAVFAGPVCAASGNHQVTSDQPAYNVLQRIADVALTHACMPGVQLATTAGMAGAPWEDTLLELGQINQLIDAVGRLSGQAHSAGFKLLELRADTDLVQQFLHTAEDSRRIRNYGGPFYNRIRLLFELLDAVREQWPKELPLLVRLGCRERPDVGWTLRDMHKLVRVLGERRDVDMIVWSCSDAAGPVARAAAARERVRILREASSLPVGLITACRSPAVAEALLSKGYADLLFLTQLLEEDPVWPRRWAHLGGIREDGPEL